MYGDRLMRILAEEALCRLPSVGPGSVRTPVGTAEGLVDTRDVNICLVSVVRSGKFRFFTVVVVVHVVVVVLK